MFKPPFARAGDGAPVVVDATVKWFNPTKGFGFVTVADAAEDIFVHASALQAYGAMTLNEGATVRCEVVQGQKGRQVSRILKIDDSTAAPSARQPRPAFGDRAGGFGGPRPARPPFGAPRERPQAAPLGPPVDMEGTVKWYKAEKGFGFVTAGDGGKDVFVHLNVLRRAGLASLEPDQHVVMTVITTEKGREATSIRLG